MSDQAPYLLAAGEPTHTRICWNYGVSWLGGRIYFVFHFQNFTEQSDLFLHVFLILDGN